MQTPAHDDQGRPLLSDEEYHKYHMMEEGGFMNLPRDVQERYRRTSAWHFERRMGDVDVESIQTGDGSSYREKLEYYRKVRSQKP